MTGFVDGALNAKDWRKWDEWAGRYSYGTGSVIKFKPSSVECPYCREKLSELDRSAVLRLARVAFRVGPVRDVGMTTVKESTVPPTHILLSCRGCDQMFTLPVYGETYKGCVV